VNNILKIILILSITNGCSFNKNSKFWTTEKISEVTELKVEKIFTEEDPLNLEFNPGLNINLISKAVNKSFTNNNDNNDGRINFDSTFSNKSKFKFKKIDNFFRFEPEIVIHNDNIIFFDNKGAILKFDNDSNLIWKKNFYKKQEKKLKPILQFANDNQTLVVADNISKYYALDIKSGELLWSKYNDSPFNSQIKIFKDKFFIIDSQNILTCYSIKDGSEIWKIKTSKAFIKSQKKLSIIIMGKNIYFNNSVGDVSAAEMESGNLLWQTPTQDSLILENSFSLKTADMVGSKDFILVSNNRNNFFSLDANSGAINWEQKINTHIKSTVINDFIFSLTMNGFLTIIDSRNGNLIRATDILSFVRKKGRINLITRKPIKNKNYIKPVGFIVGLNNLYVSTNNGRLLTVDIKTGKTVSIIKIDKNKISRPFVTNKNLFLATDSSIIKLN
jgi:outer membrane protein assembly factor BamB